MKCTVRPASIRPKVRASRIPSPPFPTPGSSAPSSSELRAQGLHPSPLPLGLRENCIFCNTCNSFPCKIHAKSDAEVCAVKPATATGNVTLWVNAMARRLITDSSGKTVEAVEIDRGGVVERVSAPLVIVVLRRGQFGGAAAPFCE